MNPDKNDVTQQRIEKIQEAVRQLPSKYRDVLVLRYLEGLPTQDIVDILSIRESTMYTRLNRAKQYLKEKLLLMDSEHE